MNQSVVAHAALATFVLCWLGGLVSWFFAAYYTFKASRRFKPKHALAKFNPFSFLIPEYFTDEGNYYRSRSVWSSLAFLAFCGVGWYLASPSALL